MLHGYHLAFYHSAILSMHILKLWDVSFFFVLFVPLKWDLKRDKVWAGLKSSISGCGHNWTFLLCHPFGNHWYRAFICILYLYLHCFIFSPQALAFKTAQWKKRSLATELLPMLFQRERFAFNFPPVCCGTKQWAQWVLLFLSPAVCCATCSEWRTQLRGKELPRPWPN